MSNPGQDRRLPAGIRTTDFLLTVP